jgi:hypothetical protein
MMKIAYLILAHSAPQQLARLTGRLQHPQADCFIHIDRKVSQAPFEAAFSGTHVRFVQRREKVYWGAYSIVQATINGIREILDSRTQYTHICLLSGQDYPLWPAERIVSFFLNRQEQSFLRFLSVEHEWQEAMPRLRQYHLTNYRIPGRYRLQKILNQLLPVRQMPYGLVPVGRSQWFTLATPAAQYVLDYLDTHRAVRRFFKLTWAPDELLFQTVLYNSRFRERLVNDDLRYVDWSEGKPSPRTLTMEDAGKLTASGKIFARKFDMQRHPEILDYLDFHTL